MRITILLSLLFHLLLAVYLDRLPLHSETREDPRMRITVRPSPPPEPSPPEAIAPPEPQARLEPPPEPVGPVRDERILEKEPPSPQLPVPRPMLPKPPPAPALPPRSVVVSPSEDVPEVESIVATEPIPGPDNPLPPYPRKARRFGWEGTVLLSVEVLPDGSCGQIQLLGSSGHPDLDRAAVSTVRDWRFTPAQRGGVPETAVVELPIVFRLDR